MSCDLQVYQLHDQCNQLYRVGVSIPSSCSNESPCCIFVNSGQVVRFDDQTKKEVGVFTRLKAQLAELGIASIDFDLPKRIEYNKISGEADIQHRYDRLTQVLNADFFEPFKNNYMFVGLSLGGQTLLKVLEDAKDTHPQCHTIFLLSTVVENPVYVYTQVKDIHLVYGSRDCVAYCDSIPDIADQIFSPESYASESAHFLVTRKSQKKHIHILQGVGHLMDQSGSEQELPDPVEYICTLIKEASVPISEICVESMG